VKKFSVSKWDVMDKEKERSLNKKYETKLSTEYKLTYPTFN